MRSNKSSNKKLSTCNARKLRRDTYHVFQIIILNAIWLLKTENDRHVLPYNSNNHKDEAKKEVHKWIK